MDFVHDRRGDRTGGKSRAEFSAHHHAAVVGDVPVHVPDGAEPEPLVPPYEVRRALGRVERERRAARGSRGYFDVFDQPRPDPVPLQRRLHRELPEMRHARPAVQRRAIRVLVPGDAVPRHRRDESSAPLGDGAVAAVDALARLFGRLVRGEIVEPHLRQRAVRAVKQLRQRVDRIAVGEGPDDEFVRGRHGHNTIPAGGSAARTAHLLGSYRIDTAPEPNSRRPTSFNSIGFDSPANSVGPCPASFGCTTNSYSSISPSSASASGSVTPPTNSPPLSPLSPLPPPADSRLSRSTASARSPRPFVPSSSSAFQSTIGGASVLDTTYFLAASIVRAKGSIHSAIHSGRSPFAGHRHAACIIS